MTLHQLFKKFKTNPKQLFLIDGFGALVSAFFLGVVLVKYENVFGMPRPILYWLSFAACVFAIYDFVCYFKSKGNWRPFLKTIALINIFYCAITIGLLFFHQKITALGITYFLLEVLIVVSLAIFEWFIANQK